jgi:hypothetical protein
LGKTLRKKQEVSGHDFSRAIEREKKDEGASAPGKATFKLNYYPKRTSTKTARFPRTALNRTREAVGNRKSDKQEVSVRW